MLKSIKKAIKYSNLYQHYKIEGLMPISPARFSNMYINEKTNVRLCANHGNKLSQFSRMCKMVEIKIRPGMRYQTWIDTGLVFPAFASMTDNIPPDYSLIIDYSIEELKSRNQDHNNKVQDSNLKLLNSIESYINRIIDSIDSCNSNDFDIIKNYYSRMITNRADSIEEAFQRILFWSSLFWQTKHRLVGLGRLDKILDRFENDDIELDVIIDFFKEIHRYYSYKSNKVTLGDTGQIIILGGLDEDGDYFCNSLTYKFIEAMMEIKLPDPKLLLRVSHKTPDKLLKLAVDCISTGIGCPLLSNDDIIIPALEDFGYLHYDACNYVTSACWEPVAYGKSLEKNNILDLNFANAIVGMYTDAFFTECAIFDDVVELYKSHLLKEIINLRYVLDSIKWEPDPLMSLFTGGCIEHRKDISEGGAVYNDYGVLTVGLSNAINSLINIKHLVFEGKYSLNAIADAAKTNYISNDNIQKILSTNKYYGKDEQEVVELTTDIMNFVHDNLANYRNMFNGKLKWGLSSSNYLENGKNTEATVDGRKKGEPLGVHISCQDTTPLTDLVSFASKLNYKGCRSNGNVVDFIVSPNLIKQNEEKFLLFIKQAITMGFFQMQMNVVDSKTLIAAKEHPENYPNLIVRVWGFSAYFNDLPEEYKSLLIERALQSEGVA